MPTTGMNRPLQQGLVLWLKMSEGTDSRLHDVSPYRNNGTLYGPTWTDGKFGKALSFDGLNDYVDCGSDTSLDVTEISIAAWLYLIGIPADYERIIQKLAFPNAGFVIGRVQATQKVELGIGNLGGWASVWSSADIPITTWTHVVGTHDSSNLRLYINGTYDNILAKPGGIAATANPLYLGGTDFYLDGRLDDVRIYNRALSSQEIQKLFRERGYV